jgi:hypothetical protein
MVAHGKNEYSIRIGSVFTSIAQYCSYQSVARAAAAAVKAGAAAAARHI